MRKLCKCGCGNVTPIYYWKKLNKGHLRYIPTHKPGAIVNKKRKCRDCKTWTSNIHQSYCRPCHMQRGIKNRCKIFGTFRNYWLQKRYNITEGQFLAMAAKTNGICPVCLKRPIKVVDHCHTSNIVRGVLCHTCNRSIGNLGDTQEAVKRLAQYFKLL